MQFGKIIEFTQISFYGQNAQDVFLKPLGIHTQKKGTSAMAVEGEFVLHDIFTVDPLKLLLLVGQFVKVSLINGSDLLGTVYTVDPVSQSIVLVSKEDKSFLKIILKHSIKSINNVSHVPENHDDLDLNNLFSSDPELQSQNGVHLMKERVMQWLIKNMVPVKEEGNILVVDTLEIHPPYSADRCYGSNSIILDRVQNLIKEIQSS